MMVDTLFIKKALLFSSMSYCLRISLLCRTVYEFVVFRYPTIFVITKSNPPLLWHSPKIAMFLADFLEYPHSLVVSVTYFTLYVVFSRLSSYLHHSSKNILGLVTNLTIRPRFERSVGVKIWIVSEPQNPAIDPSLSSCLLCFLLTPGCPLVFFASTWVFLSVRCQA